MNTQQDNQVSDINSAAEQPSSVGKTLREAREQLGLSLNDVSNRIKFAARQIEALEADDYAHLPEAAFVRGFVRSYARLLVLDPAHLLSGLPTSHMKGSSAQEVKSVDIPLPSAFSPRRHNIMLLSAGLVIALSVVMFMRLHDRVPEVAGPVTTATVQVLELPDVTTESAATRLPEQNQLPESAPQQTVSVAPAPQPVLQQAVRTAPVPAPVPAAQQLPTIVRAVPAPAVAPGSAPVAEQPKLNPQTNVTEHALRLEFDQNSWVEIRDGNDKILISKMHLAGSLVRLTAKAPLLVTIGNAHAVRLFDNGKQINLERHTTADVARVNVK